MIDTGKHIDIRSIVKLNSIDRPGKQLRNILIVADACRAGTQSNFGIALNFVARKSNIALLLGCEPGKKSYEAPALRSGVYTYFLLKSLSNSKNRTPLGGLWASKVARCLEGDFVECGTNKGFMASAIMEYLDWNSVSKTFYLMDTFAGIDPRYTTAEERTSYHVLEQSAAWIADGFYTTNVSAVTRNFAQWPRTKIISGVIPETLEQCEANAIAFLHIDMNCAPPEIAALRHFWPRIVKGGMILLDDYAYAGYEPQKRAMDALAKELAVGILSLPTGQGLIVKQP